MEGPEQFFCKGGHVIGLLRPFPISLSREDPDIYLLPLSSFVSDSLFSSTLV